MWSPYAKHFLWGLSSNACYFGTITTVRLSNSTVKLFWRFTEGHIALWYNGCRGAYMKSFRKLVAAILACLMLTLGCSAAAYAKTPSYETYVVLGDSIATGYQQPTYVEGQNVRKVCWPLIETAYPGVLAKMVSASKTYMMAKGGWRTVELRAVLDKNYFGDAMCRERLPLLEGSSWQPDVKAVATLRHGYRANIKKADLITVQIGSNDVWQPIQVAKRNLDDPGYIAQLAAIEASSVATLKINFDEIIRMLRKLNPDAKIVVLGLYNPVASESLEIGPLEVPYGDLLTQAIRVVNAYMRDGCPYADEYEYVNVMGIETLKSHPGSADYVDDPHPTAKGHRQIAKRILAVV